MALSDLRINDGRAVNEIIIFPFIKEHLGSASYDVRLGQYYFESRQSKVIDGNWVVEPELYNIYSEHAVRTIWGDYKTAISGALAKKSKPYDDWSNIGDEDEIIMLGPRANLLCHTLEFIGAKCNSTTMMKARSSIGRSLVNVCQCAGMGDVGFFNRWTMEIYNRSDFMIPLVVNRRIAQIVFLETGPTEKVYLSKYQDTDQIAELEKNWHPDMMLPALFRDRELRVGVTDGKSAT
jgi:dCTP deaminase